MRIDFHTHVVTADLPNFAERHGDSRWPVLVKEGRTGRLVQERRTVSTVPGDCWSPLRRLEDMDSAGIDLQVLSPLPALMTYWSEPGAGSDFSRHVNDSIAEMVHAWPRRFAGLGTVPLQDTGMAVAVLSEAHRNGLSGVEIGPWVNGKTLDLAELRPFFAAAAELGMIIFVHPFTLGFSSELSSESKRLRTSAELGRTSDIAIAAVALVLDGVAEELPNLRISLAHGGGAFSWALPRIARLWADEQPNLNELTENLWVDTVVGDSRNLLYLSQVIGRDRLLYGTGYPLPAANMQADVLADLPVEAAPQVRGGNALELMSREQ